MLKMILLSFVLPLFTGAGVLAFGWLCPPLRKVRWIASCAFGVALACAFVLAYFGEMGYIIPTVPPLRSEGWLIVLGLFCLPLAIVLAFTEDKDHPWIETTGLVLGLGIALLPAVFAADKSVFDGSAKPLFPDMGALAHGALAIEIALALILLVRLSAVRVGPTIPCALAFAFLGGAALSMASGWISLTILFGVLSAVSATGGLFSKFSGLPSIGRGGASVAAILLILLCTACWYKTTAPDDLHWWYWVLVAVSPFLLVPLENRLLAKLPDAAAFWLRMVVVAIPVVYVIIKVLPMITGDGGSDSTDEMDQMMQMYQ